MPRTRYSPHSLPDIPDSSTTIHNQCDERKGPKLKTEIRHLLRESMGSMYLSPGQNTHRNIALEPMALASACEEHLDSCQWTWLELKAASNRSAVV